MKPSQDKKRLVEAVEHAENLFWNAIASDYPEITSGDFPPDLSMEMSDKLTQFVTVWLKTNEPQNMGTVEVLFHNIEYSFYNSNQDIDDHVEQIAYEITNGSRSGELFFTDFANNGGERTVVGEWGINNG
jgi:hypothetical protein